jgi:UDP-N-acetylglucosamine/UDP-N-acetylgalactosamine diphosphorylase
MIGKLHREWLRKAHVKIDEKKLYEISPTISYAGEGLKQSVFDRELGRNILEFDED